MSPFRLAFTHLSLYLACSNEAFGEVLANNVTRLVLKSYAGFYGPENTHLGEAYIRLGVCKSDESLALAEQRLKKLKPLVK